MTANILNSILNAIEAQHTSNSSTQERLQLLRDLLACCVEQARLTTIHLALHSATIDESENMQTLTNNLEYVNLHCVDTALCKLTQETQEQREQSRALASNAYLKFDCNLRSLKYRYTLENAHEIAEFARAVKIAREELRAMNVQDIEHALHVIEQNSDLFNAINKLDDVTFRELIHEMYDELSD